MNMSLQMRFCLPWGAPWCFELIVLHEPIALFSSMDANGQDRRDIHLLWHA